MAIFDAVRIDDPLSVCAPVFLRWPLRAGSFNSATGSVSAAACAPCSTGAYCASPGAVAPTLCPSGSEQPLLGQTSAASCTLCTAGQLPTQHTLRTTALPCRTVCHGRLRCPHLGSFDSICVCVCTCSHVRSGKFAAATGTASCAECAAGKFSSAAGAVSCSACAAGQYQGAVGQSSCSVCSAGEPWRMKGGDAADAGCCYKAAIRSGSAFGVAHSYLSPLTRVVPPVFASALTLTL